MDKKDVLKTYLTRDNICVVYKPRKIIGDY
jgi:hypothetical protein